MAYNPIPCRPRGRRTENLVAQSARSLTDAKASRGSNVDFEHDEPSEQTPVRRFRSFDLVPRTIAQGLNAQREAEESTVREKRIAVMEDRYHNALDIWTGRRLAGRDLSDWFRTALDRAETEVSDEFCDTYFDLRG